MLQQTQEEHVSALRLVSVGLKMACADTGKAERMRNGTLQIV